MIRCVMRCAAAWWRRRRVVALRAHAESLRWRALDAKPEMRPILLHFAQDADARAWELER